MLRTVLIANRGEIACRIIRTCRRMGLRSVAVYSDADRDALHVRQADRAVRIGPAEAAASYLNAEAIIGAAVGTGADAIHPGYGFLSERIILPELCAADGIVWIGPHAEAIRRMGSKIESKRIAQDAGVACVPGYRGADQSEAALRAAAEEIGFPVLIKASAGGGGRGMRQVDRAEDFGAAVALARAEAEAGFGDGALLIEKRIGRPRHIEVQLAGDKHGNIVHLFERECSIQRNYQKVVEEAPAPGLDADMRAALYEAALRLGRAIGYDSLGTVEFLIDADGSGPWFLEMNTRLQVEHPVTEAITGLDLVEWQIRIAAGETLPLSQGEIAARGAAIEVRLNAEDPAAGYLPCLGAVAAFEPPQAESVRVDTGVGAGSVVGPHYDSLLAKVIAYGADRDLAAARLSMALRSLAVLGVGTNQAFLRDIVEHPQFRAGRLTTGFLAAAFPGGWGDAEPGDLLDAVGAALAWSDAVLPGRAGGQESASPWTTCRGFRVTAPAGRPGRSPLAVEGDGGTWTLSLTAQGAGHVVEHDGVALPVDHSAAGGRLILSADNVRRVYAVALVGDAIVLSREGSTRRFTVRPAVEAIASGGAAEGAEGGRRVTATLPGLVSAIPVQDGQRVAKGETVVVIEAMKLLHALPAPADGTVSAILCSVGQTIAAGAALIEIAAAEA